MEILSVDYGMGNEVPMYSKGKFINGLMEVYEVGKISDLTKDELINYKIIESKCDLDKLEIEFKIE